ncbi:CPBP family intramembrane glutamic endopeptidase [Sphingosinicella rhizophila]|uniref:Type II CAAX endopeptidase family protein n=1 Tax=Sphingosinicella rhizophila TaxID=3050082 RepID=A0ABU3Q574_9SPHN|nr:type II CAAX endopeptidase family protein [Sphingosinicella sp. GR2756]MDT9598561.1 type II CAAX endopeptidase family protein [Sphingosinicella sp. GR2756]
MTPGWIDHVFVILALLLIFPIAGWWSFQRFLARAESDRESALLREYRETLLWLFGLGAAVTAIWLLHARSLEALFFREPVWGSPGFVTGLLVALVLAIVARPIAVGLSRKMSEAFANALGKFALFLPTTPRALALAILVSLAAGLFEEVAYRGYLLPYFENFLPLWGAVIASSVLFGLGHIYQGVAGTVSTTFIGLVMALAYLATGSLWVAIGLHALLDISSMLMAYLALRERNPARV